VPISSLTAPVPVVGDDPVNSVATSGFFNSRYTALWQDVLQVQSDTSGVAGAFTQSGNTVSTGTYALSASTFSGILSANTIGGVVALLWQRIEVPCIPALRCEPRLNVALSDRWVAEAWDTRRDCRYGRRVQKIILVHAAREEGNITVPLQVLSLLVSAALSVEDETDSWRKQPAARTEAPVNLNGRCRATTFEVAGLHNADYGGASKLEAPSSSDLWEAQFFRRPFDPQDVVGAEDVR